MLKISRLHIVAYVSVRISGGSSINTLRQHAYPRLGNLPVDRLTPSDFAEVLKPIWLKTPETADRVRQRCHAVMEHCIAEQLIQANPLQSVKKLLPQQKKASSAHHCAVPYRDLPDVMQVIYPDPQKVSAGRSALTFVILTATRSGEVRKLTWDQIDFAERMWHIPAENTKTGAPHEVPLSDQALRILNHQRGSSDNDYKEVFRASTRGPLSDITLTKVLRDNNIVGDVLGRTATTHGFRSTFRDWAAENGYPFEVAEAALAHAIKGGAVRPYYRTRHLEQRKKMMNAWGDYVFSKSDVLKVT
ncbi:tyrosine-type recombinase/integrase [Donghicola sp. XS_ASV15]|uniref:tyrosine-type recombinase/integrase n=1 Tax=Donghicola sp. XS_ASV15 TaxID=3241295 RepID=UPI0035132AA6